MNVNTTSAQFSASYIGAMVPTSIGKTKRIEYSDLANAQKVDLPRVNRTWEERVGLTTTDTVAEDGTVTRTMSGGYSFLSLPVNDPGGPAWKGRVAFSVSLTFDPDIYQGGDLGATADLLAAARAAEETAARKLSPGEAQSKELQRLDEVYEGRKNQVVQSFAGMVSGYLEATTQSGQEEEKVERSVRAVFSAREAKYRALADGTRQELWMSGSLFEAAVNLQRLGAALPVKDEAAGGLYSLQELDAAAVRISRGFDVTF